MTANAPSVRRRRLILLTNDYPVEAGDVTFVAQEIPALASAFDEVVVFSRRDPGDRRRRPLPENVRYGGHLDASSPGRALCGLLRRGALRRLLGTVAAEQRAGRLRGHARAVVREAAGAMARMEHPALWTALSERDGTEVSVYAFWAMGSGLAVPFLPRVSGIVAVRLHRYDLYDEVLGWLPLRGSLLSRPDVLLPISEDGASYLRAHYPWSTGPRMVVSRLGTSDGGTRPARAADQPLTVASCSAVIPVKRVAFIADVVGILSQSTPVRWIHFGTGSDAAELDRLAAGLRSPRLDIELRGQTVNADVLAYYGSEHVDVFVNASTSEGVPVSIMEALSFDIPVVATDVGGVAEIVSDVQGSGVCVDVQTSADDFARAVSTVAAADGLRPRAAWHRLCDAAATAGALIDVLAPDRNR